MCDQDHFEDDKVEHEAKNLVTRRQFGVLGAGVAMMLPRVVNAVTVTDGDVTITTPDGSCDAYFVHPASAPLQGCCCGRTFSAAAGDASDGQAARGVGLLGRRRESVLSRPEAPTAAKGAATPIQELMPRAR
jgi:carboxymethylenebutenolidase